MRTKNTYSLEDEQDKDAIKEICGILAKMDDADFIEEFFKCLFTSAELKDFSNRWHLVKELDAGTTQREISRKYGMSLCNITRGSKEMKKEGSAFRKVLDMIKESTGQPQMD
ncbi:MAG: transcriptional regulator [Treponema sp.]|nr:transcriptional regulator [Treponema sp.]